MSVQPVRSLPRITPSLGKTLNACTNITSSFRPWLSGALRARLGGFQDRLPRVLHQLLGGDMGHEGVGVVDPPYRNASIPLPFPTCSSFSAAPIGRRSPRSHWLTVLTATFRNPAMTAWLTPARSRTTTTSAGDRAFTTGRASRPNIRSVVFRSSASLTAPTLCRARDISTISDRIRALPRGSLLASRSFFIPDLHQFIRGDQCFDLVLV